MKTNSFTFNALILSISTILCKIIGAVYKIPLTNILGTKGIGIYYLIFPVYAFLLTFVSSNFTQSISKLVSKNKSSPHRILKASILLLLIFGAVFSLILVFFSKVISLVQGVKSAFICYLVISPSIIFVAISSSFKGFFQGLKNMTATSISQILSQIAKVLFGFCLALIFNKNGEIYGAFGALLGVTISELVETLYFVIYFFIFKKKNKEMFLKNSYNLKPLIKEIYKETLPFTLNNVLLPFSVLVDSFLVVNILKSSGFEKLFATGLLGLNSGVINTLINIPITFSSSICMTLIPFVSYSYSKGDIENISKKSSLAFKFTFIIVLPCVFAFLFFPKDIINLLFSMKGLELSVATSLLCVSSINAINLSLLHLSSSLLQGVNKTYVPVISLFIGLVLKVFSQFFLMGRFNIFGLILSNTLCYFVSSIINIIYFRKFLKINFDIKSTFICPLFSCGIMTIFVFLLKLAFKNLFSHKIFVLLSFVLGGVLYFLTIFLLKTFTKEEKRAIFSFKRKRSD